MKNIFTLLLGTLMAASAFAADAAGSVLVSFASNNDYLVYIDGRGYQSYNSRRVYVKDMRPGRHTIEVYSIKKNNKRSNRPVYTSSFTVRPQYDMNIIVDRSGRVQFDERQTQSRNANNRDGRWDDRRRDDDRDRDWSVRDKRDYRDRDNRGYDNRNGNYGNDTYNRAMSEADFNQLLQNIRSQWIGKFGKAKEEAGRNYFTTYQVRQLVLLFSSEDERLELAKLAFRNTVDRNHYRQLYDLFSYNAQVALDRYINEFRY